MTHATRLYTTTAPTHPLPSDASMASALTLTSTRNNDSPTTPTRRRRKRTLGSTLANAALHLTPNYFAINMGTGIVSILLHNFPYPARWLEILGVVVFVLNVAVFVLLCAGTVARYVLWRGMFTVTAEGNDSFGWGTFPMGFVTIVVSTRRNAAVLWGGCLLARSFVRTDTGVRSPRT